MLFDFCLTVLATYVILHDISYIDRNYYNTGFSVTKLYLTNNHNGNVRKCYWNQAFSII